MIHRLLLCVCLGCSSPPAAQLPKENPASPQDKTPGNKPIKPPALPPTKSCDPYAPRDPAPDVFIGAEGAKDKLLSLIASAQTSLDVLIYDLSTDEVIDAFIAAKARGVAVRLVLDRGAYRNIKSRERFTAAGVPWRDSPAKFNYAHSKTMLIDGTRSVIMSLNMDKYSFESERNYAMVSTDPGDAEDLKKIFEADWNGTPDALDLACTRLIVSPVNARDRLTDFVASATDTLDFSVMYLTDPRIMQAVLARKKAGVDVRVLLADPEWMSNNANTAADLLAAGIPARYLVSMELHAKLIIADDKAFVGSVNYSTNSLDNNREVGAFIANSVPVRTIRNQFEADWLDGVSP